MTRYRVAHRGNGTGAYTEYSAETDEEAIAYAHKIGFGKPISYMWEMVTETSVRVIDHEQMES